METGRPSKYKPEYCEQLIAHMSRGFSFESFGADVNVGRRTLFDWLEVHEEWKEAKEIGEMKSLKFVEGRLVSIISGQKITNFDPKLCNPINLMFTLKTRFHKIYGEKKVEVDEEDEVEFIRT